MSMRTLVGTGLCARTLTLATILVAAIALPQGARAQGAGQGTSQSQGGSQPSAAQQAQQDRMRNCNAEAGTRNLAGDARRDFMGECLAGRMPPPPAAEGRQPSAAQQAQQDRMRDCNTEAGRRNLAGDARRDFMGECLGGRTPSGAGAGNQPGPAQSAQQDRMRTCNAEAGTRNLAGDARRDFMSECLAGRGPATPRR